MRNSRPSSVIAMSCMFALIPGATGCLTVNFFESDFPEFEETRISGSEGAPNKILMLDVGGILKDDGSPSGILSSASEGTVARIREQLDRAAEDDEIKALLVRIDSPGGSATASDLAYQEILRFKEDRKLPVVAQLMGTAASGGYYISVAADEIVALPTTVTGSIGVIYFGVSVAGLMDKLGIYDQTVTSGSHKGAGIPTQRMSTEQRDHLQSIIDALYARFVHVVDLGRANLNEDEIRKLADGRVFSAPQALAAGLIDSIGGFEESVEKLKMLGELDEIQVVTYHRSREYRQNFYTRATPSDGLGFQLDIGSLLGIGSSRPGFFYLWAPHLR